MSAFATSGELTAQWRTLSTAESAAVDSYLESAAVLIRDAFELAYGTRDVPADRLPAAKTVSLDIAKTALTTSIWAGHLVYGRTEGPRAKSGTLAAAGGSLTLLPWHRELLGLPVNPEPRYNFPVGDY